MPIHLPDIHITTPASSMILAAVVWGLVFWRLGALVKALNALLFEFQQFRTQQARDRTSVFCGERVERSFPPHTNAR